MKTVKTNRRQAKKSSKKSSKMPAANESPSVPNIKELLLNGPKFDLILPKRKKWRRSPPVIFD
jgi:hypothetical protein